MNTDRDLKRASYKEDLQILKRAEKYSGNLPFFFDPNLFPELKVLKDNWESIRDEIFQYETTNGKVNELGSNPYVAPQYEGENWSNIFLENFMIKHHKNRKRFPITSSVIDKIPNVSFAVISILSPQTIIKPHYGDTNGIVRSHLGLSIPDSLPNCGIRVGDQEKGWEDGELVLFTEAYLHGAWNKTNYRRYVLVLDIVPDFINESKFEVCTKLLGAQSFNYLENRFSFFKLLPDSIASLVILLISLGWKIFLPIQRKLSFL